MPFFLRLLLNMFVFNIIKLTLSKAIRYDHMGLPSINNILFSLKADRPHPRDYPLYSICQKVRTHEKDTRTSNDKLYKYKYKYPHTPTDYRHTDKSWCAVRPAKINFHCLIHFNSGCQQVWENFGNEKNRFFSFFVHKQVN